MSQLAFLFKIFQLRIEVENAKYLQINQPYIVVCNHQSSMDLMGTKLNEHVNIFIG